MIRARLAVVLFVLVGTGAPIRGDLIPALNITNPSTSFFSGQSTRGYSFTANQNFSVGALGYFDSGSGLGNPHDVGLWDANENLLATASVSQADPVIGFFRYHNLASSVGLVNGQTYYVGGLTGDGEDVATGFDTMTVDPRITYLQAQTALGSSLTFPGLVASPTTGHWGGTLAIANAVPEPSSLLLCTGMAALFAAWRGRCGVRARFRNPV